MPEQIVVGNHSQESAYRDFFKNEGNCIITLGDLFDAIEKTPEISTQVGRIFAKKEPITILVEGSAFEKNIDVLDHVLVKRNNPDDVILLVDISKRATIEHSKHIKTTFPNKKYHVIQGDMNNLPISSGSVDLVINDCAVNFNTKGKRNKKTLVEIKRLLKPGISGCLFSAAVDRKYDDPQYGYDQELVPPDKISTPGFFYPLPDQSFTRACWPVPYYKSLFTTQGFNYTEFDVEKGKTYFPEPTKISYRRFFLSSSSK